MISDGSEDVRSGQAVGWWKPAVACCVGMLDRDARVSPWRVGSCGAIGDGNRCTASDVEAKGLAALEVFAVPDGAVTLVMERKQQACVWLRGAGRRQYRVDLNRDVARVRTSVRVPWYAAPAIAGECRLLRLLSCGRRFGDDRAPWGLFGGFAWPRMADVPPFRCATHSGG